MRTLLVTLIHVCKKSLLDKVYHSSIQIIHPEGNYESIELINLHMSLKLDCIITFTDNSVIVYRIRLS